MVSSVRGQDEPKSCAVIGYPSGQDGAILPVRVYPLCPVRQITAKAIITNPLLTKLVQSAILTE